MILRSSTRAAMLAAIVLALAHAAVYAGPQLAGTKPSLLAQSWNLEIATRRPPMRVQISQCKQFCVLLTHVEHSQSLRVDGSPAQWPSRPLRFRAPSCSPSRAPPLV